MKARTVLITGSTSGIGIAIARAFAAKGYNIVFNGLERNGEEIAEEVAATYNINFMFSAADMLQPADIRRLAELALARFGVIDVLINNAGIQYVSAIEDFPEDRWNDIISINLSAAFHLTKAVWQTMKAQHFGRIINIASVHGLIASEFKSAYVAAKHGLIGLTKTAALEGASCGITCNAVCPGFVRTPLVEKQMIDYAMLHHLAVEDVMQKVILGKHAIKEFIPVEIIAETCILLASDIAGTITGTSIPVDGGWSAQ